MGKVTLEGFNSYEEALAFAEWFGSESPKFRTIEGKTYHMDVLYYDEYPLEQEIITSVNVYEGDSYTDLDENFNYIDEDY